ncbi:hypothetical protein CI238_04507, partial [Colletotrichum incanum]
LHPTPASLLRRLSLSLSSFFKSTSFASVEVSRVNFPRQSHITARPPRSSKNNRQNGQPSDHQPDHHARHGAGLAQGPLRRPQRPEPVPCRLHCQQHHHRHHLPLRPGPDQQEEGSDHPQVRRAGADGLLGGGQARHDDDPRLRLDPAPPGLPLSGHGHRHDGLHAHLHEVHQPPPHPVHHPPQERPREQSRQDPRLWPARLGRPQAPLQGPRRLHAGSPERPRPERQEGHRDRRACRPRWCQGGVNGLLSLILGCLGRTTKRAIGLYRIRIGEV